MKKKEFSLYSLFIWFLAISFYFYEFYLRIFPATVSKNIMESLHLSLEEFAALGSAYYISYSIMQLPAGMLLDRFKFRILIVGAVSLCAGGTLLYSISDSFYLAYFSRLIIGIGSSFGFVGLMIVTLSWFKPKYFAFLLGCGQFVGAIGPLFAGGPTIYLLKKANEDWRLLFVWVAIFGFVLTVLIGMFLKEKPLPKGKIKFINHRRSLIKDIKGLLKKKEVWLILTYAGTVYVSLPILGAYWGVSYLESKGIERGASATIISMIWIGLAIGGPLFGKLSDYYRIRKPFIVFSGAVGVLVSPFIIFSSSINPYFLGSLFFLIGIAGSGQNLSFAIMTENTTKALSGTALGLNNMGIMGIAATIPLLVTALIRTNAVETSYTVSSYQSGLILIPVCFLISLLIALFGIRETFCRNQNAVHPVKVR